jgi:phosphoglycerate dehydrogenase-like enzyme
VAAAALTAAAQPPLARGNLFGRHLLRYNAAMRTLKLGIVGCGVIGRRHVQAAAAFGRIELVAVARPV